VWCVCLCTMFSHNGNLNHCKLLHGFPPNSLYFTFFVNTLGGASRASDTYYIYIYCVCVCVCLSVCVCVCVCECYTHNAALTLCKLGCMLEHAITRVRTHQGASSARARKYVRRCNRQGELSLSQPPPISLNPSACSKPGSLLGNASACELLRLCRQRPTCSDSLT